MRRAVLCIGSLGGRSGVHAPVPQPAPAATICTHNAPAPPARPQMIADIDKDGSGTIDFDEFLQVGRVGDMGG